MARCLLIFGMHRSGTSVVAGLLQERGFWLGNHLMPADQYNPKGYFENINVFQFHESLLNQAGVTWHTTYLASDSIWKKVLSDPENVKSAIRILQSEFDGRDLFLIKDPRLSLFLPIWITALESQQTEFKLVHMYRPIGEVIKSFANREVFDPGKSSLIWMDYHLKGEVYGRPFSRLMLNFQQVIDEPGIVLGKILDLFGLNSAGFLHSPSENLVDKNLKHFNVQEIPDWLPFVVIRLDRLLRECLHSRVDQMSAEKFDELSDEMHKNVELFKTASNEFYENKLHETDILLNTQAKAFSELEEIKSQKLQLLEQLENWKTFYGTLTDEHRKIREEKSRIELALGELSAEHQHVQKELQQIRRELDDLQNTNRNLESQLNDSSFARKQTEEWLITILGQGQDARYIGEKGNKKNLLREVETRINDLNKSLLDFKFRYDQIRDSWSYKIGWYLTRPLGMLFDAGSQIGIIPIFSLILRRPKLFLGSLNSGNFRIFWKALGNEPWSQIIHNARNYLYRSSKIIDDSSSLGRNKYHIDEQYISGNRLTIRGWFLTDEPHFSIVLEIHGQSVGNVMTGIRREDVEAVHPGYANSSSAGFVIDAPLITMQEVDHSDLYVSFECGVNKYRIPISPGEPGVDSILSLNEQYRIFRSRSMSSSDQELQSQLNSLEYKPLISIITPVYNVDPKWLNLCIQSVLDQVYGHWELCLYDDASTNQATLDCLINWENKDRRIKIKYGKENLHIARASNKALEMAEGEFIALLDNDDELTPWSLGEVVKILNVDRQLDFIYSDEDKITVEGELVDPHFKPDWSPETFESLMYTCHLAVFRASLLSDLGGFREGYEGSQDYDLVLRVTRSTSRIYHITKILYHWRKIPGSAAESTSAKGYAYESALKALQDHMNAKGLSGVVEHGIWIGSYRSRYQVKGFPSVDIIVPFRDQSKLTEACIDSIKKSTYGNYRIILISNNSTKDNFTRISRRYLGDPKISILQYDEEFNYSRINNWAVSQGDGEYLLFLNNDTKVITTDWIENLLELAVHREIGAVGCKLLYEDDTIQHAGIVLGIVGIGNHAFRHMRETYHGYFGYADVIRNYAAVTGACLMVNRKRFREVGGFDEELPMAYNDIDLCLKLQEAGYRNVYTPFARLYHYESKTRGVDMYDVAKKRRLDAEVRYFRKRWKEVVQSSDRYYNPNLTLAKEDFSLRLE